MAAITIPRGAPLPLQGASAPVPTPPQGAPLPIAPSGTLPAQPNGASHYRHVAQEFKSVFLNEMLGPMFEGLSTDGLGGGGVGEEMFRPLLIDSYAKAISHSGGIGIADHIVSELTRMQAAQSHAADPAQNEAESDGPAR